MLRAVKVKPNIYWVGAIDWNERNFHGYTTERGTSYNSYLIMDEKITLIDTVKPGFEEDLLERIQDIIDPAQIDYVISNHVEMDHSGSIPVIMQAAPKAKLITGSPKGLEGLKAHYGDNFDFIPVKTGDSLEIGKRTLTFVQTPMVHWPDNMVTYDPYDGIVFSNDAFGQHYASSKRFDDEVGFAEVLEQAKKYYANIVMPYSRNVARALSALSAVEFDMICPAHGIIWRSHVKEILEEYGKWCTLEPEDYAIVVYDSMWHSTEAMAMQIMEAFMESGVPARLFDLKVNHISDIMTEVLTAKFIAVGSPTLNATMMPTVASFLCYLKGLTPKNRVGIPFGSYGWITYGPDRVADALKDCGYSLPMGTLTHQWTLTEEDLDELHNTVLAGIQGVLNNELPA